MPVLACAISEMMRGISGTDSLCSACAMRCWVMADDPRVAEQRLVQVPGRRIVVVGRLEVGLERHADRRQARDDCLGDLGGAPIARRAIAARDGVGVLAGE